MQELKFRDDLLKKEEIGRDCCIPSTRAKVRPPWVIGEIRTAIGPVCGISTELTRADLWEHIKCRASAFRESYTIPPGIYAVGNPDKGSDVLVSANYKLSFDHLRQELKGMNLWVLVLDTKGINVWCAAGKGTFGTDELVRRISVTRLAELVDHRKVILPQLGAPGTSAHIVRKSAGFKVLYGPVYAKDIRAFIASGYKASRQMRTVRFNAVDRLVLTPMEINPALKKYYSWYALFILAFFGLRPNGIIFADAFTGGLAFLILGLIAVFAGGFLTPLLLPFIPFRSFALKGWLIGLISVALPIRYFTISDASNTLLTVCSFLFFPMASSYIGLQFTGSTTFTGMSGVKKELKISLPLYVASVAVSIILLVVYKLGQWSVI